MLSALLRLRDLDQGWRAAGGSWTSGESVLRPFAHEALHAALWVAPSRTMLVVRERAGGRPASDQPDEILRVTEEDWERELAAARAWPLEFLALTITGRGPEAEIRLHAGHWGSAPVYLHVRENTLRIEWDAARLYPHLTSTRVDPSVAAEYVVHLDYPNSRRTLFPEISRLTERATAVWRAPHARVSIRYPAPAWNQSAGRLLPEADVVGTFREILSASMRRWRALTEGRAAVELSGGLDSGIVAATAASIAPGRVRSLGLIMPGRPGEHQQARRACFVRRFRLIDRTIHGIDFPPFAPESRRIRAGAITPWEEFYYEATATLHAIAGSAGARLIFSGMGGDELATLQSDEPFEEVPSDKAGDEPDAARVLPSFATRALREAYAQRDRRVDPAPDAILHSSTIESATAVSALSLRDGFWPVHPLCTPELVEFCRRLPFEWRRNRRLHRAVLASFGLPARVTHPRPRTLEHFSGVMEFAVHSAAQEEILHLFEESRLAEQGLVDRDRLVDAFAAHVRAGKNSEAWLGLIMVELTLRAVDQHRARTVAP